MIENLLEPLVAERFRTDGKYRTGHIRVINPLPGRRVLGVHIPEMRKLARSLAASEDALELICGFESAASGEALSGRSAAGALAQEELLVWGMMINFMKTGDRLDMMKKFVPHIDNWAVCDTFVPGAKWFSRVDGAWDILCGYFASDREFEVRFAVIMSMCHFLDLKWLPRIFYQFDNLDFTLIRSDYTSLRQARSAGGVEKVMASGRGVAPGDSPYYVRMGVAWFLATALAKFPDDTRAYLRHSRLPEDVLRLYARKARESFRTRSISPF